MPGLLDKYKAYKNELDKYAEALAKLDKRTKPVSDFLQRESLLFDKLDDMKPGLTVAIDMKGPKHESVLALKAEMNAIEEKLAWYRTSRISSGYIAESKVSENDIKKYMVAFKKVTELRDSIVNIKRDIGSARRDPERKPEIPEADKYIKAAKLAEKSEQLKGEYDKLFTKARDALSDAYQNSANDLLKYINKKKITKQFQDGKLDLKSLEVLAAAKEKKQDQYFAQLPAYVRNLLPPGAQIKGVKGFGEIRTNTQQKVLELDEALKNISTSDKPKSVEKITNLLAQLGVKNLDKEIIEKIYDQATLNKLGPAASQVEEKVKLKPRVEALVIPDPTPISAEETKRLLATSPMERKQKLVDRGLEVTARAALKVAKTPKEKLPPAADHSAIIAEIRARSADKLAKIGAGKVQALKEAPVVKTPRLKT